MLTVHYDGAVKECWFPWRPWLRPINVYYYSDNGTNKYVRLQDHLEEVVFDIQRAKTYMLVRTPDRQTFMGEILSDEDGSHSKSSNNGPWTVEIGKRLAENITGSVLSADHGQYIGRIEVAESTRSALDPVSVRFVSVEESPEQPIKKDE